MLPPMFGMGASEIVVILIVALLFLGPEKLPEAAKQLSRGIRDLRKQTRSLQETIEADENLGGAIRDLKSALRGEDDRFADRPRRTPPATPPLPVALQPVLASDAGSTTDESSPSDAGSTADEPSALDVAAATASADATMASTTATDAGSPTGADDPHDPASLIVRAPGILPRSTDHG
jgi:sec-independent protein translocase protein TatB